MRDFGFLLSKRLLDREDLISRLGFFFYSQNEMPHFAASTEVVALRAFLTIVRRRCRCHRKQDAEDYCDDSSHACVREDRSQLSGRHTGHQHDNFF